MSREEEEEEKERKREGWEEGMGAAAAAACCCLLLRAATADVVLDAPGATACEWRVVESHAISHTHTSAHASTSPPAPTTTTAASTTTPAASTTAATSSKNNNNNEASAGSTKRSGDVGLIPRRALRYDTHLIVRHHAFTQLVWRLCTGVFCRSGRAVRGPGSLALEILVKFDCLPFSAATTALSPVCGLTE